MEFYEAQQKNSLFDDFIQPRIAKYDKIFTTHLMGSPTVIVNGANANKSLLSNEFKLVVSSWPSASVQLMGKDSIMEKQGERHHCLHRLIGEPWPGGAGDFSAQNMQLCAVVFGHKVEKARTKLAATVRRKS
ncbi:hypothetical protein ACFX15_045276 [Malus domestica]